MTDLIAAVPDLQRLTNADGATVAGLLSAARPAVIAAISPFGQTLVITSHPHAAQDLANELRRWTGRSVGHFPAIESFPYERVRLDRVLLSERESVLAGLSAGTLDIVIAPARALLQPVEAPQPSNVSSMTIETGSVVRPDELIRSWVAMGYAETRVVEDPGTFARRGGVIDIFPAGADSPVRIDLFGNDVESLRAFDPVSQRSVASLRNIEILPLVRLEDRVRSHALDALRSVDTSNLNAEAETRWREDLERLEQGAGVEDLTVFLPYLLQTPASLLSYFSKGATVIVDSAPDTWTAMDDLCEQAGEVQRGMEESGVVPRALRPALLDRAGLEREMTSFRRLEFVPGTASAPNLIDLSGLFLPAHSYAGRLRGFVTDAAREERVVVATQQCDRLAELFAEEELTATRADVLASPPAPGITLIPGATVQGWTLRAPHVVFLTDHEIFGRSIVRPIVRKKRSAREAFFTDFAPGDYVVHLEHGIGRFEGVTRMSIEGAEREYAVVQYAGKDRVYVPTESLERLTRYVGSGESAPQLNKLGGGEWQRARARAKAAAADIARELIELYAKRKTKPAFAFSPDQPWQHELEGAFPFEETPDQLQAINDVKTDMEEPHPMDRLVCADVGYGKTEVAVRAAFKAVMDGRQVAVLVPTTILAQQHYETFSERFGPFPARVEVLSRFRSPREQKEILRRLASGEVDVVIGTHRLLSKDVTFKNLGLLIIDEEQRFGVKHKEQLKRFRESVDVLTLTATPIPRTLHSGIVGIREISVIETPPEGRLPIKTYLQPVDDRLIREAILRELDRDGQVYFVHNKVATIEAMAERIRSQVPEARIVVAHGQMDEALLEHVMLSFAHHEADVLICSTIIENGLDIPNVNTIVVNNAHRLGLTQLYQLRGRVGRSANQAYAYLLYPLDAHISIEAAKRMEAVFEAQDLGAGFSIAMKDLEIRGTGNLLGAEQSGHATAIGFDLYTRMIGDAVERLRGVPVEEPPSISISLPLTTLLPAEYVGSEAERLMLYRRLAGVSSTEELLDLEAEMRDRFGALPQPVQNLATVVRLKLLARTARVSSITFDREALSIRSEPGALYDRVGLYRKYGMDAKISNALLKIARVRLGEAWIQAIEEILVGMTELHAALARKDAVPV